MVPDPQTLRHDVLAALAEGIDGCWPEERFNRLALRIFAHQDERNAPYRRFCEARGISPGSAGDWREVPALPAAAFKSAPLCTFPPEEAAVVYTTSGTTLPGQRGRHYLRDTALYDASLVPNLRAHLFPDVERIRIAVLAARPEDAPESSLSHMLGVAVERWGAPGSRFYLAEGGLDLNSLLDDLAITEAAGEPVCLMGAAFAFVHLIDRCAAEGRRFRLPAGSRIMDTGGYKGRSREVPKEDLYRAYGEWLGIADHQVVNEYGMTEMSSQFYDAVLRDFVARSRGNPATDGRGASAARRQPSALRESSGALDGGPGDLAGGVRPRRKVPPPWVRTFVVDPETLEALPAGRVGLLRHYDLANVDSVMAIQTDDLGVWLDGGFEILGRAAGAEPRGCSLGVEEALGSVPGSWVSKLPAPGIRAFWLPPAAARELEVERPAPERPVPLTAAQAADLCVSLRERRMELLERPAAEIAADLGRVSDSWLEPGGGELRAAAGRRVAEDTGYPPALIARSLAHFFRSHSDAALSDLVKQSLGAPEALDGFVLSVGGRSRAFGPSLTLLFASGNVPVAPLASVYHSLLVKSPCVARAPSGSPSLLAFLGQSLCAAAPQLGECFAVLHWERDAEAVTRRLASEAEAVVAFGSDASIAALATQVPPGVRLIGHGHRLGFGMIGREALTAGAVEQTAADAAVDVAAFDQQGCVSPRWFYVEGGGETPPDQFADRLAEALARIEAVWPRRGLSPGEASAIHQARAAWEVRADARVRCSQGTGWTVVYTPNPAPEPGPLNRFVFVKPVADVVKALPDLSALARYLQTVSCALDPARLPALTVRLCLAGVTRICPLGRAQEPLPGHHDGASPLGELVRWVDLE